MYYVHNLQGNFPKVCRLQMNFVIFFNSTSRSSVIDFGNIYLTKNNILLYIIVFFHVTVASMFYKDVNIYAPVTLLLLRIIKLLF